MSENQSQQSPSSPWSARPYHRKWLLAQADGLFDFFQGPAINPKGGFYDLSRDGKPLATDNPARGIHASARMVHCYAIGQLLGRPGSADIVDHGMRYLWERHRDEKNGGYFWQANDTGAADDTKQGYGHAFVLLAASSAKCAGHPLADAMLADITEVIEKKFWEESHGAIAAPVDSIAVATGRRSQPGASAAGTTGWRQPANLAHMPRPADGAAGRSGRPPRRRGR